MAVKYGKFQMPQKITKDEKAAKKNYGLYIAEPFEPGFGHTVGNAMRRILLSSLESPAIISIRIEGVLHECMAIEGIIEDMINICLNLKGALLRKLPTEDQAGSRETRVISTILDVTQDDLDKNQGKFPVTLGQIVKEGSFEVVNPELHLFTVTAPLKKEIEVRVAIGRGYIPSERLTIHGKKADEILIDAIHSPVRLVNYYVENTRVGQDTDFDRLILEITTDGRLNPDEALSFSAQIGLKHFEVFTKLKPESLVFDEGDTDSNRDQDELRDKLCLRIDEIELSVRSTNCLKGANIETIGELVAIPERDMLGFRNFGKKSLNEIKDKLREMNLWLGMDLHQFGIDKNNAKQRMKEIIEEKQGKELAALDNEA